MWSYSYETRVWEIHLHLIICEIVDCYCIYETITLLTRHCHGFDRPREKGLASPGFRNGYVPSVQDHIDQRNRWHHWRTEKLPQLDAELADEMRKLEQMFWIDQQKLKEIVKQFEVELDEGLKENNKNIVRSSTSCLHSKMQSLTTSSSLWISPGS